MHWVIALNWGRVNFFFRADRRIGGKVFRIRNLKDDGSSVNNFEMGDDL